MAGKKKQKTKRVDRRERLALSGRMVLGHKMRIYPTKKQREFFEKCFATSRYFFNYFLAKHKAAWREYLEDNDKEKLKANSFGARKSSVTAERIALRNGLVERKQAGEELSWIEDAIADTDTKSIERALDDLEVAIYNGGSVRFRSQYAPKQSYRLPGEAVEFHVTGKNGDDGYLIVRKFRRLRVEKGKFQPRKYRIRFRGYRDFSEYNNVRVKSVTISRDNTKRYYCSYNVELDKPVPLPKTGRSVGIDVGMKMNNRVVLSSLGGEVPFDNKENVRLLRMNNRDFETANKIRKAMSRCTNPVRGDEEKGIARKKGSNNYERLRIKLAKLLHKVSNRSDVMDYNEVNHLVDNHDHIYSEDFSVEGIIKGKGVYGKHKHNRMIYQRRFGRFFNRLEYKSKLAGRSYVKIGRYEPSSQTCFHCGYVNEIAKTGVSVIRCPVCDREYDRDYNAANNIRRMGEAKEAGEEVKQKKTGDEASVRRGKVKRIKKAAA